MEAYKKIIHKNVWNQSTSSLILGKQEAHRNENYSLSLWRQNPWLDSKDWEMKPLIHGGASHEVYRSFYNILKKTKTEGMLGLD